MSVSCLLCGEASNAFHDSPRLRTHLVAEHAPYVAEALLAPDLNDPQHFWLLAQVAYSTPSIEQNTESEQSAQSEEPDDAADDEGSPELAEDPLTVVLKTLLQNGVGHENESDSGANSRKRSLAALDDEDPAKRPHFEVSLERLPTSLRIQQLDQSLLFEKNDEKASASGLEETSAGSAALKKAFCQMCKADVCSTARQRHVYLVHVKQSDMFKCSHCDYTNSNSVWEMRKHCNAQHAGEGAHAVSNEDKYKSLIQSWNRRCFPDWKQKRPPAWTKTDTTPATTDENVLEATFGEDSRDDSPLADGDEAAPTPPDGVIVDDRTCHLCWEESRYPGRHISQKHLKKPLYECPVCEGFGSYESCTVIKHIHKVHPEKADVPPISNLEKYADEIRDLQARCFPNRPMKLVRPHQGSRPRERHHCKLCNVLVAQSDRQRHVYHRHLQRVRIFECPLCSFASNYDVHRVKWHIKWMHKDEGATEPISHENEYRQEIDALNERCFPGWQHRRRPFWWLDQEEAQSRTEMLKMKNGTASPKPTKEETMTEADEDSRLSLVEDEEAVDEEEEKEEEASPSENAESEWTCKLCGKEFKPSSNFLRHVAKEHLSIPLYQCPVCEGVGGQDAYEIRAHMAKVHGNTELQPLSNLERHAEEIQKTYQQCFPGRKLKNVNSERRLQSDVKSQGGGGGGGGDETRVQCRECLQEMKTEDRQIHVYRHHLKEPRLYECPLCDFSHHACSSDVKAHIKYSHREHADAVPKANLLEFSSQIAEWNDRCFPGWINRRLPAAVLEDFNRCRLCNEEVRQTSRHIAEVHLLISLHQCPLCEYGAAESRLVRRHMKNNHKKKDLKGLEPIANVVERRAEFSALHDKCFPGRPKRLSNITISDEGRRAKCRQCGSTISRKRRLAHLLERHVHRPVYKCSACPFNSQHDEDAVAAHAADQHSGARVLTQLAHHKKEIAEAASSCFSDWHFKLEEFIRK